MESAGSLWTSSREQGWTVLENSGLSPGSLAEQYWFTLGWLQEAGMESTGLLWASFRKLGWSALVRSGLAPGSWAGQ